MAKTKKIQVSVVFEGIVEIEVPKNLSKKEASVVAEKYALCKLLATTENPDSPDDVVIEELADDLRLDPDETEKVFDKCKEIGISGTWTTKSS